MPSINKLKVFSALEVAKFCGVVNQTVINWIRAGHLKASVTPGGQFRVYPDDLRAFLLTKSMRVPDELQALCQESEPVLVIVEDDQILNNLITAQLTKIFPDILVLQAFDGFEAGSLLGARKPQAVVLDLNLPGVDGLELCRRIKADPGFKNPFVVAITAGTDPGLEQTIRGLGANAFFQKPVDSEQIAGVLRNQFKW